MASIPITIEKIKMEISGRSSRAVVAAPKETVMYLFKVDEPGQKWQQTFICDRVDLLELRSRIDKLIEETTTAEVLKINPEQAKIIDEHYRTDKLCQGCKFKLSDKCKVCLFDLQSPLERQLFLELSKTYIKFQTQYGLNRNGQNISVEGKKYGDKNNNYKEVLTIVDFYIEKRDTRLCVYTDGHTYHERTEDQALRDRNIDRKLQEFGFQVLRYTGKEVNEGVGKIIEEIKKWIQ